MFYHGSLLKSKLYKRQSALHTTLSHCGLTKMTSQYAPEGKTFLVTGGASGIGALIVETFVKEGAKGVVILDIQADKGKELADRLNKTYPNKVTFVKCDVSDEKNVNEAFDYVFKEFKQLDVVINNAGVVDNSPTMWRKSCDINWQGLIDLTLKGIKHMRTDEGGAGGTIINIGSTVAFTRYPFIPIYSGSKAAVLHFSQCISRGVFSELTGVRLLTVCFGPTDTAFAQGTETKVWDKKTLKELLEISAILQKPECAAATVLDTFKKGANGSVWLSIDNKPGKDITDEINKVYAELERIMS